MAWTLEEVCYRVLPRVPVGRVLSASEWRTLESVAEILLAGCPVDVAPRQVADNVERFLVAGRSRRAFRVRVLLTLLEYATVPEYRAPFSRLSADMRRRVVEDRFMHGGTVWSLCAKVRLLVMMGAYGDERAHRAIGTLPVLARPRIRRRTKTAPDRNGNSVHRALASKGDFASPQAS